jgi:hypothetical protein
MSWLSTFLLFCGFVIAGRHLILAPSDIRGRSDFLKFQIAAQGKDNPQQIVFCTFDPGPAREIDLNKLQANCFNEGSQAFVLGSLTMAVPSGQVPLIREEPEYGWTRYKVLSGVGDSQLIETETYYNSDALITRYRVTGRFVEPVGQINVTFGLRQMLVVFYLPMALLLAKISASLLRILVRKHARSR